MVISGGAGNSGLMLRLEVEPPLLAVAAGRQRAAAERLAAIAVQMQGAGETGAGAAGEAGLGQAISGCCGDGAAEVRGLHTTVAGLSANLEGAAALYTSTDESAMPGS